MPRFYFHAEDGKSYPDEEGTELRDVNAARDHAMRLLLETAPVHAIDIWTHGFWRVRATDDTGLVLFQLEVHATTSSALRDPRAS